MQSNPRSAEEVLRGSPIETLRPGDRLVIVLPSSATMATVEGIKDRIRALAPELLEPIIISGAQVIISRAGEKE